MEHWKDIVGYEGRYQVSDLGRVRSLKFGKEHVMKGRPNTNGYLYVALFKDGKARNCSIHRLVAEAFIPNPCGLPCINHKDENHANNVVGNIEWCDAKYNCNYGTRNERIRTANSKPVYQYTKDGVLYGSYSSTYDVERRTGYCDSHISQCCRGERKYAYGYMWSYTPINNQRINLF
jgi:hypothetical protein